MNQDSSILYNKVINIIKNENGIFQEDHE